MADNWVCDRTDFVEIFTISQVWHNATEVFLLPGHLMMNLVLNASPPIARFLEIGCFDGADWFAILFSIIAWGAVGILWLNIESIHEASLINRHRMEELRQRYRYDDGDK